MNSKRNSYLFLFFIWLLIQAILVYKAGIVTRGEAPKYIEEAIYFTNHHSFSQPKYFFYGGYIFLHVLMNQLHTGVTGMYIVQLLLNLLSIYCFFRLAQEIIKSQFTATLATLLLLICFPWQNWVTHLYTESVFISLVIIFSYLFFKPGNRSLRTGLLMAFVFLLLLLTRPTGLLFIPVVLLFVIRRWLLQKRVVLAGIVSIGVTGLFILVLNYAMKGEGEFDFLKPFIEEHIICGVPTAQNTALVLPANGNSLEGLLFYVFSNPGQFLQLAGRKMIAFFSMTRSYYSPAHNFYLAVFFYPLYLLSILGVVYLRKVHKAYNFYWISMVAIFTLSVLLTCDDWLNRFIMPILPFIILAAAAGVQYLNILYKTNKKVPLQEAPRQ
jgi:Dolichyl-phosphate-mannose-protein mannosyltransferase